jgi:hypothetical protein
MRKRGAAWKNSGATGGVGDLLDVSLLLRFRSAVDFAPFRSV